MSRAWVPMDPVEPSRTRSRMPPIFLDGRSTGERGTPSGYQEHVKITLFRMLRGRDLALHAAAVTFYSGIAVVPVALLAIWLTGLVAGADRVRRLTGRTIAA